MASNKFPTIKTKSIDLLIPYARNSRTHSDVQVGQIAASIKEFGFLNPVIIDGDNGIIAGHGRVLAAKKLGMTELPCVEASHLTDTQRRAYIIADNKLALNAGWDDEILRVEFDELSVAGFDLDLTGFSLDEIAGLFDEDASTEQSVSAENYSRKVEAPIYKITGSRPAFSEMIDRAKTQELQAEIQASKLPQEISDFLCFAAERHTIFNFRNIAEFYAHADEQTQSLMERSALIIIDFDKAVEQGFVRLSREISEQYLQDYADAQ
jgi:hypothetical protein